MKKLFISIVGILMVLLTSCSEKIVFNVSMEVTPTEVKNGDEITISIVKSEDTNVDFKAEVFWEDEKIGEVSKAPYQLKYVVDGMEEGFYTINSIISYGKKKGTISSSGTFKTSKIIYVTE
jgi:hypothetical protein